ncbi:mucoidy inhibitor MuiA family protein [Gymnodinialimonas sp.]
MKHFLLTTALCAVLPFAALADDIVIRADLAEATVFGQGAQLTRSGLADLPAGRHRLIIAMPDLDGAELPQVLGEDGLRIGPPQELRGHPIAEGALDDAVQAAARAAVEAAEAAVLEAQDALTQADAAIRAIEAQQGYIAAILRGGEHGVAMPEDPSLVAQFLSTLGAETARLAEEALDAQVARRDLAEAMTEAQRVYAEATQAFRALRPFGTQINGYAVDVTVVEAGQAEVHVDYFSRNAGWRPSYEVNLDSDSGALTIDRFVTLETFGAARWVDVDVTFSTAAPGRDRSPSTLASIPARLLDPAVPQVSGGVAGMFSAEDLREEAPSPAALGYATAAMEPVVIVEDTGGATAEFDGLSVSYTYDQPVSITSGTDILLSFDTMDLEVETENRAVPRWDETAFLIAMMENDTGEPILPGDAIFYRDGALLGDGYLPLIPAGAEAEMAFGALDHLQLTWIDRSLAEGDRGLFVSSTTQAREIAFGVENTGTEAAEVRILYATPFAEQEDLEMDLTLSPRPTEEDVDDARGIHAWDLEVGSGETDIIEMTVEFEYPEGQILDWQP